MPSAATSVNRAPTPASLHAGVLDFAWSAGFAAVLVGAFLATTPSVRHWFVVPVFVAGTLAAVDAVRVARRELDLFDPQALLSFFAIHFFLLAPLLHIRWDTWLPNVVEAPADWRPWLGRWAMISCVGLVFFRAALYAVEVRHRTRPPERKEWRLHATRFWRALAGAIGVALLAQLFLFVASGGWDGYVDRLDPTGDGFEGMGSILLVAESLPMLVFLGVVMKLRGRRSPPPYIAIAGLIGGFVALQFVVAGLRGSRANLIFGTFIALGMVHFLLRRIPRSVVVAGVVVAIAFSFLYAQYKLLGVENVFDPEGQEELEERTGYNLDTLLLRDLGRADVQASVMYRMEQTNFDRQWGVTYIGGVLIHVPGSFEDLPGKGFVGGGLLYGPIVRDSPLYEPSNIYGLAGEWMLNFGVETVPLAYLVYGLACGAVFTWARSLTERDTRRALIPVVAILTVLGLASDIDNVIFPALQFGLLPAIVLFLGSDRHRLRRSTTASRTAERRPASPRPLPASTP